MRTTHLLLTLAALAVAPVKSLSAPVDDPRMLSVIRDFAIAICPPVDMDTSNTTHGGKVGAAIDLPGLLKKLLNLKLDVSADYRKESSHGPLREHLAELQKSNYDCRLKSLTSLYATLLPSPAPVVKPNETIQVPQQPKSGTLPAQPIRKINTGANAPVLRVFLKNNVTSRDAVTLASLLPEFAVKIGRSAVDPEYEADTLFVSRDKVTTGQVLKVMKALEDIGVPIKSVQQQSLGNRKEVQVGTMVGDAPGKTVFWDKSPLVISDLQRRSGSDFWRTAANGIAICSRGIGFGAVCKLDDDGRPVEN